MKAFITTSICMLLALSSCIDDVERNDTPRDNFEALWQIIDEHYCFFEHKNINWDSIHSVYSSRIDDGMTPYALFDTLSTMLAELKDGHVNLYAPHDIGRYWNWTEDYPLNFHTELQRHYLGKDYRITGCMSYTVLKPDSIGYIYVPSFASGYSETAMNEILYSFRKCSALILDLRSNGGGALTSAEAMAGHFTTQTYHAGYMRRKSGKQHNDFAKAEKTSIKPSNGIRWMRPTVVLTNRGVFSATNWLVNCLKPLPHVIIVGDRTGGGSGFPMSSELSNGWGVRYSASQLLSADYEQIEFGIEPDMKCDIRIPEDVIQGTDNIIETARYIINSLQQE